MDVRQMKIIGKNILSVTILLKDSNSCKISIMVNLFRSKEFCDI